MTLFQLTLKNLTRRPVRTVLTIMGIGVGIGAVVALLGLAWGLEASWFDAVKSRGTDMALRKASGFLLAEAFEQKAVAEICKTPGIDATAGILTEVLSVEEVPTVVVSGREWGSFVWDHLVISEGRMLQNENEKSVVLGKLAAEQLKKKVGDTVTIEVDEFEVVGIANTKSMIENATIFLSLKALQSLVQKEGKVNFINIRLKDPNRDLEVVRKAVAEQLPAYKAESAEELSNNNEAMKTFNAMTWGISFVALLAGAFGVMNTMFMSVFERTREIGVLLALGWRRGRILRMIVYESIALCFGAGILGVVFGVGLLQIMKHMPIMEGKLEPYVGADLIGLALALAVMVGLLSGLYPALRCTKINPSIALRQ